MCSHIFFFYQAEDGIRDYKVTGVQTCALPIFNRGLAYHPSGKLFIELLAGDLLALDAKTGKQLWRVKNADYKEGSTMKNGRGVCLGRVLISWGAVSFNKKKR